MKRFFYSFNALLLVAALSLFVSCDLDEEIPSEYIPSKVDVHYSASLGEGFYNLYDVTLEYVDIKGDTIAGTMNSSFVYSDDVDYNRAPRSYHYKVVARLKDDVVVYDSLTYDMSRSINAYVAVLNSAGEQIELCNSYNQDTKSFLSGDKVREYIEKYPETTLIDFVARIIIY